MGSDRAKGALSKRRSHHTSGMGTCSVGSCDQAHRTQRNCSASVQISDLTTPLSSWACTSAAETRLAKERRARAQASACAWRCVLCMLGGAAPPPATAANSPRRSAHAEARPAPQHLSSWRPTRLQPSPRRLSRSKARGGRWNLRPRSPYLSFASSMRAQKKASWATPRGACTPRCARCRRLSDSRRQWRPLSTLVFSPPPISSRGGSGFGP